MKIIVVIMLFAALAATNTMFVRSMKFVKQSGEEDKRKEGDDNG